MKLKIVSTIILMSILMACRKPVTHTPIPPAQPWEKTFGGSTDDHMTRVLPTPDGGYIMTGYTYSTNLDLTGNKGRSDIWVVKLKANRDIEWQKNLGSSEYEYASTIALTPEGGYMVAGGTNTANANGDVAERSKGDFDIWVIKLNSLGRIVWQKTLGGSMREEVSAVAVTTNGDYVVLGNTSSGDGDIVRDPNIPMGESDIWILKLNGNNGDLLAQNIVGSTKSDHAYSIAETPSGYMLTGYNGQVDGTFTNNTGKVNTAFAMKLDLSLKHTDITFLGGDLNNPLGSITHLTSIITTTDGGYMVAGSSRAGDIPQSPSRGSDDFYVAKLTNSGTIAWQKLFGGTASDYNTSIAQTTDGNYIIAGTSFSSQSGDIPDFNKGNSDICLMKVANSGQLLRVKLIGGSGAEMACGVFTDANGRFVVGGVTSSQDGDISNLRGGTQGVFDFWLINTDF